MTPDNSTIMKGAFAGMAFAFGAGAFMALITKNHNTVYKIAVPAAVVTAIVSWTIKEK